jgi:hypothetical protein
MKRPGILIAAVLIVVLTIGVVSADAFPRNHSALLEAGTDWASAQEDCWPNDLPVGAVPGQPPPVFCSIDEQGPDTSLEGPNSWVDEFDHGLSFAGFAGTRYQVFEKVGFVYNTLHWRHADHWMVDLASHAPDLPARWVRGGALMRPDRAFHFENGRLVVEADAAASVEGYVSHAWPELVISTGSVPHDVGSLYAYDLFPEDWTLGCRLQDTRFPVCTLKSDGGDATEGKGSAQVWEISAHQQVGTLNDGGHPFEGRGDYWRLCGEGNPDDVCRDRFRLELTQTSLTLFVNGFKYFEQTGLPPLPDELVSGEVYVYFASMVVSHPAEAIRFHWDRLSVNPGTQPSPAPGAGLPVTAVPSDNLGTSEADCSAE